MRKLKRFTVTFLAVIALFTGIFCMGCNNTSNKKYDVSIKIKCDSGGEWIFTPDVEELHTERNYDGREHRYYISEYQLVGHPDYGDKWFATKGEGADVFGMSMAYRDESGEVVDTRTVKGKGEYCMNIHASATSDLWVYREIRLYITVK